MSYTKKGAKKMSLFNKYRPKSFEEILGNESLLAALQADLQKEECPHAILLSGQVGCGKTSLARIIASEVGCKGHDFREVDSADFRGIDTIREIRKQAQFKPLEGDCRVWLIDEAHQMTKDAQNALLKALETPPSYVYYILATTDPDKLIDTVKSRCAKYQVNPLTDKQMFRLLRRVAKDEGQSLDDELMKQIILDSQGRPRDALQILDQVLSVDPDQRLSIAKKQAELQNKSIELCRALIQKAGWKKVGNILAGLKDEDPERVRRAVLGYCSAILLKDDNSTAGVAMEQMIQPFYNTGFPGLVFASYSTVKLSGS
jgi:DNA polymerase III subunit gamma/tau